MSLAGRLALSVAGLFVTGALLVRLAHRGQPSERRRRDWLKYAVFVGVINGLWLSAYLGAWASALALGLIVLFGSLEVLAVVPAARKPAAGTAAMLLLALALAPLLGSATGPGGFAFVVLITATTDSFSELMGRLVGRRKLCPRLSPQKTVAGLWGGLAMAVVVALLLGFLLPDARPGPLALVGLATALGAVAGDLLFSGIKRAAGVKDFSGRLPGHGGVLDRFDSLVLAAPAFQISRALLLGGR